MESPLESINRQIQQENKRHKMVIDNINKQKEREYTQHQQTIRILNNRKEQNKQTMNLKHMEEILNKAECNE